MAKGSDTAVEDRPQTQNQGILDSDGEGFTFDMEGTEADDGFPVLDKGTYDGSVETCEYKISQSSGHPMWAMRFLVTGPGEEVADKKVQVRYYQSFKPEQMPRAKSLLQKLGRSDLATKSFNPKTIADDAALIGATCRLRLDVRNDPEYGRGNEVKGILPAGGGTGGTGDGGFSM
jgi:hypothetical protein